MVSQKYRWDFIGLSTDEKPTSETSDKVVNGSTYYCSDTSKLYVYCDGIWYERKPLGGGGTSDFNDLSNRPKYNGTDMTGSTNIPEVVTYSDFTGTDGVDAGTSGLVPAPIATDTDKYLKSDGTWATVSGGGTTYTAGDGIDITNAVISATNTGKAKILSTEDYNYPTDNPTVVSAYLLPAGMYAAPNDVKVSYSGTTWTLSSYEKKLFLVTETSSGDAKILTTFSIGNGADVLQFYMLSSATSYTGLGTGLTTNHVKNNLTSTNTDLPLSAKQGKVLKDLVDSLAIRASGAPTTSTVGTVGQLLEDTTNGKLYICTDATNPYVWEEVGAGGGSGGFTELTAADYNYPTDNPTSIALWLLDEGAYSVDGNGNTVSVKMNSGRTDSVFSGFYEISNYTESGQTRKQIEGFYNDNGTLSARLEQVAANGTYVIGINLAAPIISQSTGTSVTSVMSQKATTDAIKAISQSGTSAPTTSTVGVLGQLYTDTTNMHTYQCTAISGGTYTWTQRW